MSKKRKADIEMVCPICASHCTEGTCTGGQDGRPEHELVECVPLADRQTDEQEYVPVYSTPPEPEAWPPPWMAESLPPSEGPSNNDPSQDF